MKPEKIEEGKWVLRERTGVNFDIFVRNPKVTFVYWISLFTAFGPLQILLQNDSYEGKVIFGHNPFVYFITQGLFISTLSVGVMFLVCLIIKKRTLRKEKKSHSS